MSWLTVLGLLLTAGIGVWRFVAGKARRTRQRAEAAGQMGQEGIEAKDPSRITASLDRLNRP